MDDKNNNQANKLVIFQSKKIRRIWNEDEWYYSVVDIVAALTDSPTPRQYWGKVKEREFIKLQLSPIWVRLKLPAKDGKIRQTDCVNTKGAFRLIQSIPSKKAEPFKRWLAQVGQDRLDEIGDSFIYFLRLCDELGIDPIEAANDKMLKNAEKYPADKAKGNAKKYTEF